MAGKYFYKDVDITNLFQSPIPTNNAANFITIPQYSGITYYSNTPVINKEIMRRPYPFGMTTPEGDISEKMNNNTIGLGFFSLDKTATSATIPLYSNHFTCVFYGCSGGGGGGGGCGWSGPSSNGTRRSGDEGNSGSSSGITVLLPYVPIKPGSTINFNAGSIGTGGAGGIDKARPTGGAGTPGAPGNAGTVASFTFTMPDNISYTIYANGGAGGQGGAAGNQNADGVTPTAQGPAPTTAVAPATFLSTYRTVTSEIPSSNSPTTPVTMNTGLTTNYNLVGGAVTGFPGGLWGYGSKAGNPAVAQPGYTSSFGGSHINLYLYKI